MCCGNCLTTRRWHRLTLDHRRQRGLRRSEHRPSRLRPVTLEIVKKYVLDMGKRIWYLSAPEGMCKAMRKLPVALKGRNDNARMEAFTG